MESITTSRGEELGVAGRQSAMYTPQSRNAPDPNNVPLPNSPPPATMTPAQVRSGKVRSTIRPQRSDGVANENGLFEDMLLEWVHAEWG